MKRLDEDETGAMKRHDDTAATEGDLIRKTPGVLGGDARIGDRRIAVWMLVRARQLGMSDLQVRERYDPPIGVDELKAAWTYYTEHPAEIDEAIRENEDA